jgi:antitoxin YefM
VALVAADELESLLETAHLLRSPRNAQRLLQALHCSQAAEDLASVDLDRLEADLDLSDG